MSRDTWDPAGGTGVDVGDLLRIWQYAVLDGADGLTVSGGEPLAQPVAVAALLAGADTVRRAAGRDVDLLLFTGHELEELDVTGLSALEHADVIITGRYEAGRPTRLIWRGSANQRMVMRTASRTIPRCRSLSTTVTSG
jgi:anaerobic ribonucleoside-triphosphate reductase activating protein